MKSSGVLYRSEVLFYIQNNVSSVPHDILMTTLCGFYTEEEVVTAKSALFAVAETFDLPAESLPRHRTRRGDGRLRADAADILELWEALDNAQVALPVFVAAIQKRIPPITVAESDLCVMSVNMMEMKVQLTEMAKAQNQLADVVAKLQIKCNSQTRGDSDFPPLSRSCEYTSQSSSNRDHGPSSRVVESSAAEVSSDGIKDSFARMVESMAASGGLTSVQRSTPEPAAKLRLRGKKVSSSSTGCLKTVPRRITAFVGRLHIDTTADELNTYLHEAGFINPYCRKLVPKDNRKFKSAAFCVSCDYECKELFYDESVWPAGCELRDWVFYNKPSASPHST